MEALFLLNTRAELLKTKRTPVIWLTLLAALFIPVINVIICIERPDAMVPKFQATPWLSFLRFTWKNVSAIILPMFVILLTSLFVQIEYRNNTWKQVYTLPRKFVDVFFSKFLVIHLVLLVFFGFFSLNILLAGLVVHWLNKGYPLTLSTFPWEALVIVGFRIYVGILPVTAIQYWLSLRFRNFIVPLGVGIGLWIVGIVLLDWEKIIYYPYMYAPLLYFTDFTQYPDHLQILIVNALLTFIAFLILGFWDIYKRPERG